jgi:hypothetical protein
MRTALEVVLIAVAAVFALGLLGLAVMRLTVPHLDTALMAANEAAAIHQITTIEQAETQYYAQYEKYAPSLAQLQDLIPPDLATGKSNGYLFTLAPRPNGFAVAATPETFNTTGRRSFYSDESLTIRQSKSATEPATASSPAIE